VLKRVRVKSAGRGTSKTMKEISNIKTFGAGSARPNLMMRSGKVFWW